MRRIPQCDHIAQPQSLGQTQQLGQRGPVDGPHDAAANAVCPGGSGQAAQRQANVHIVRTGQTVILQNGDKRGGLLVGLRRALLAGQVGGPMHQRLHGGHGGGAFHNTIPHGLAVRAAAGNAGCINGFGQNLGRNSPLCKPPVGAAAAQKFHHIHLGALPYYIKFVFSL